MLTAARRRRQLVRLLQRGNTWTGQQLAQAMGVSRQVIVQDVAILRAEGVPILATPRGYAWWTPPPQGATRSVVAVRHGPEPEAVATELRALVEVGVTVVNVIVEHALYGDLVGGLNLATPEDVEAFLAAWQQQGAPLLSSLTDGVHLHTLEGSPAALAKARAVLESLGFLLNGGTGAPLCAEPFQRQDQRQPMA
ncbi:MAG: transcription repressor NadR [Firmicutes bacterium]|nr:transcription repressor NadR [Alicyclobacillaceae bacterium]MCL6496877.1 transcription repressor NadR [Bacillota bacterium]